MNRSARPISFAITSYLRPWSELETNSWFHVCTWVRSAKPPFVKARSRLSEETAW